MLTNFKDLIARVKNSGPYRIAVAAAADEAVLRAVGRAAELGFAVPVLVGGRARIEALAAAAGLRGYELADCPEPAAAAAAAAKMVRDGQAQILMKGLVHTSVFMKAVLHREHGLRTGRLISLLAAYELPGYHKLIYGTDSGVNVCPDLARKKAILTNAVTALRGLGVDRPLIAALAASETADPNIPAAADAAALAEAARRGEWPGCVLEGPVAFDVAFDPAAAAHKGIASRISGNVDLLLFPNIETGNVLGKSWLHFNRAKWAGVLLGAARPVVLGSRSDTADVKLNSIALACLAAREGERGAR